MLVGAHLIIFWLPSYIGIKLALRLSTEETIDASFPFITIVHVASVIQPGRPDLRAPSIYRYFVPYGLMHVLQFELFG